MDVIYTDKYTSVVKSLNEVQHCADCGFAHAVNPTAYCPKCGKQELTASYSGNLFCMGCNEYIPVLVVLRSEFS